MGHQYNKLKNVHRVKHFWCVLVTVATIGTLVTLLNITTLVSFITKIVVKVGWSSRKVCIIFVWF